MGLCCNSIAYVYPALLRSDRFGAGTIAVAVMLELGGNVWVANIYYAVAGKFFSPVKKSLGDNKTRAYAPSDGTASTPECIPPFTQFGAPMDESIRPRSLSIGMEQPADHVAQAGETGPAVTEGNLKEPSIVMLLVKNILLWAILAGLLLNISGAPFYAVPGKSLQMLGAMFAPLLYAIIGAELKFDLGIESYGVVLRVLVCRWLCNGMAIAIVRFLPWGLSLRIQGALTLCMLTPLPSTFIMYTGLFGYRSDQAAVMYSISAISSLAAISICTPFV